MFTEYTDTKRYLERTLGVAIEGSDRSEERIEGFHGAMTDDQRERLQRRFNGKPEDYPVRILVATDAAREGLNLQNHCADLFHFDIPWNPARMEQRNGRIDRTLQPEPEVRCHYFIYEERKDDLVLDKVVEKVATIEEELGSLGTVIMGRLEGALSKGIDDRTLGAVEATRPDESATRAVLSELEPVRADVETLRRETDAVSAALNRSRKVMDFDPERLRAAVDVGLEMAGAGPLKRIEDPEIQDQDVFELPDLSESWTETLDSLRPPRERDEAPWEWRKRRPQPVVFRPLERIGEERVHLHLEHPFIQRILSRFRAQGYSANDLSRVTVIPNAKDAVARVVAFGRVSLFGPGAARLHDELVGVPAQWLEAKGDGHLVPFADKGDQRVLDRLEELFQDAAKLGPVPESVRGRLAKTAASDFSVLWERVKDEAESRAHEATQQLSARGHEEAEALRKILLLQRKTIERALGPQQLALGDGFSAEEKRQWENEKQDMEERLGAIEEELTREPEEVQALYRVSLKRLEPVGLVYVWPTTRM